MINPKKFRKRTKLFSDILCEIFQVESNYRTELNILNLKILEKIKEYNTNEIKKAEKKTLSFHIKKKLKDFKFGSSIKPSTTFKNNINSKNPQVNAADIEIEENPFTDKLVSDGLQRLLSFYKIKHKLISKEVCKLGIIIYNYNAKDKDNSHITSDDFEILMKNKNDFEENYNKLEKSKEDYFDKMNELELFLHNSNGLNNTSIINNNINQTQIKEKTNNNNSSVILNQTQNKEKANDSNDNNFMIIGLDDIETKKINEVKELRKIYKQNLADINDSKRAYIAKINEISNEIQEFNINENNIMYDFFKSFDEHYLDLLTEVKNYCEIYENSKKEIENLNIEFSNNLNFDHKIFINFKFEEYNPKFTDIKNKEDSSVIQKMHKVIGFEFDNLSYSNDDINQKDNNALFIIIMDKFINEGKNLTDKEKKTLKGLFNQEEYIKEFLNKLNIIRINKKLFYNKEKFDILFDFFSDIYSKISFSDEKQHELVKLLMIMSETFYYKEDNNKIFLNNILKMPPEIKDINFWINYIDIEIHNESKKFSNNKKSNSAKFEYIVLLSNITHLKENIDDKDKLKEIVNYFKIKYSFSSEDTEVLISQLKI